jgi:hypothetical protein
MSTLRPSAITQEKWYAPLRLSGSFETLQKAARNGFEPNDPPRGRKVRRKSKP